MLGAVRHPLGTLDYSSFLLQAQASGADIVGARECRRRHHHLDQAGGRVRADAEAENGSLILGMNGIPALGLKAAQGAQIMNPFYWDLNDARAPSPSFKPTSQKNVIRTTCRPASTHLCCIT